MRYVASLDLGYESKREPLTLQEGASGMDIKKGGAFNARPYKNPFKGPFGSIFLHRKGWGIKITSENFFEIGF